MLDRKYRLSRTKKVAYVQKGVVGAPVNTWSRLVAGQWLITIIAVGVLVLIGIPAVKNYGQQKAIDIEIKEAQAEIERFTGQNQEIKEVISYLESDQAVEDQARLNLGLKKAGEKVVVISDRPQVVESLPGSVSQENLSNPHKWFNYFFN
jgi:cell division protein FtsB